MFQRQTSPGLVGWQAGLEERRPTAQCTPPLSALRARAPLAPTATARPGGRNGARAAWPPRPRPRGVRAPPPRRRWARSRQPPSFLHESTWQVCAVCLGGRWPMLSPEA
eukprot:5159501-Prymnesium_polylepis.2